MFVRLNKDLKVGETKPSIVKQQSVVYKFNCYLCDEGQVDTSGHLYERVDRHKRRSTAFFFNGPLSSQKSLLNSISLRLLCCCLSTSRNNRFFDMSLGSQRDSLAALPMFYSQITSRYLLLKFLVIKNYFFSLGKVQIPQEMLGRGSVPREKRLSTSVHRSRRRSPAQED